MSTADTFASPEEIRQIFFSHLASSGLTELAYEDLWRILRSQGLKVRGATAKKERDTVYRALATSHGIVKLRPGVFAPRTR